MSGPTGARLRSPSARAWAARVILIGPRFPLVDARITVQGATMHVATKRALAQACRDYKRRVGRMPKIIQTTVTVKALPPIVTPAQLGGGTRRGVELVASL